MPQPMTYDVSIVGLGRVGLPLALSFAERGLRVLGIDNDPERLAALREHRMPFQEPGAQELLDRVALGLSDRVGDAAQARHIVITLGTPAFSHIEIDMRDEDVLAHGEVAVLLQVPGDEGGGPGRDGRAQHE